MEKKTKKKKKKLIIINRAVLSCLSGVFNCVLASLLGGLCVCSLWFDCLATSQIDCHHCALVSLFFKWALMYQRHRRHYCLMATKGEKCWSCVSRLHVYDSLLVSRTLGQKPTLEQFFTDLKWAGKDDALVKATLEVCEKNDIKVFPILT